MTMANRGLTKLAEELAELSVEIAKLTAYPDGNHPDGKGNVIHRMEDEMADVLAALEFVSNLWNLDKLRIRSRQLRKIHKYYNWEKSPEEADVPVQTGGVVSPAGPGKSTEASKEAYNAGG